MRRTSRKLLAILLALVLSISTMSGAVSAYAANEKVSVTLDGVENYTMANEVLAIMNAERAAEGLAPLTADPVLTEYAMQRAAEVNMFFSHTRPDGTDCFTVYGDEYRYGAKAENIAFGQRNAQEVMDSWMNSPGHRANILDGNLSSVGIGCFYQRDGSIAWVQLFHSDIVHQGEVPNDVQDVSGVKVTALASNLIGYVEHHYFGDDTCALYLYEGSTVTTHFWLVNPMLDWAHFIEITSDNYTYTSSDPKVLDFDNKAHALKPVGPGVAEIGVEIDGLPIYVMDDSGYVNPTSVVEVMPMPKLTYEMDQQGNILVDYSGFNSVASLFYKGNHDEMWTMANREADGIYTHYDPDPTDTYVYVMRYWDYLAEEYVELGERLVVKLGNEDPTPEPKPDPDPDPKPDPDPDQDFGVDLPAIPNRDTEPTVEEALEILDDLKNRLPAGTEWPEKPYTWLGGELSVLGNNATGYDDRAFCMALSDRVFGDLPAKAIDDVRMDDLRPGDILLDGIYGTMIIMDMSQDYLYCATVSEGIVRYHLFSTKNYSGNMLYALVRYESDAPGAATIHPSPVPADANIVAQGNANYTHSSWGETIFYAIITWALDDEGTMYFYGKGDLKRNSYSSWASYYDQTKRIVFSSRIQEIDNNAFERFKQLEEVVLGEDISVIGYYAFNGCTSLRKVNFPEGLTEIGNYAFYNCDLRQVDFPTSLEVIGGDAFGENSIETLSIPETVVTIGESAFSNNEKLVSLYIPAGLQEMGDYVFSNCTSLSQLELEEGITALGDYAFSYCDSLKSVILPDSLTEIPEGLFKFSGLETVYFGKNTQVIGDYAFYYCRNITSMYFYNSLRTIGDCAFDSCEQIWDVYFYGTPEQWSEVEIGSNNWFLEMFSYVHYLDPNQCQHLQVEIVFGTDATCTEDGLTDGSVCADCGQVLTEQEIIPALGHAWGDWHEVVAPTEESFGQEERSCDRCGECETRETAPLEHTHEYTCIVVEPTCTQEGTATYTCRCGETYTEVLPVIDHSYVNGYCEHCGAPAFVVGDANGDGKVNARDARLILRYAAMLITGDEIDQAAADFNGDGKVNARDARAVLRAAAGLN